MTDAEIVRQVADQYLANHAAVPLSTLGIIVRADTARLAPLSG
jgi:hypothetical protein